MSEPTAGAIRAAKAIIEGWDYGLDSSDTVPMAKIIDRETKLPRLLAILKKKHKSVTNATT